MGVLLNPNSRFKIVIPTATGVAGVHGYGNRLPAVGP